MMASVALFLHNLSCLWVRWARVASLLSQSSLELNTECPSLEQTSTMRQMSLLHCSIQVTMTQTQRTCCNCCAPPSTPICNMPGHRIFLVVTALLRTLVKLPPFPEQMWYQNVISHKWTAFSRRNPCNLTGYWRADHDGEQQDAKVVQH